MCGMKHLWYEALMLIKVKKQKILYYRWRVGVRGLFSRYFFYIFARLLGLKTVYVPNRSLSVLKL
jgi:hypothetical protein